MKFSDELSLLLKARYPIIYINTIEEDRVEYIIRKEISATVNRSIYSWDFIDGYTNNPNNKNFAERNPLQALEFIEKISSDAPSLFILKDFNKFFSDVSIGRKLKNLIRILKLQPKTIIIISSEVNIPNDLRDFINVLSFELPNKAEIQKELIRLFDSLNLDLDSKLLENLTKTCQGLSLERIRRVLSKIIATYNVIDEQSISIILNEKRQIISQTGILEYWNSQEQLENVGGIQTLKLWLNQRNNAFSQKATNYGLPVLRGLLLVGIQGTGKSLTAKVIANTWQLPLLKLDIGKLFGGLVGESEAKLRQTIEIAEALAPCILWIDEIEKSFNNIESRGDSGTSSRVFGSFITWLSEKTSSVFVVATANEVSNLPLEILRKGRFDEIFFLDLPIYEERKAIFQIHLKTFRPETWETYDYDQLAKLTKLFSGAEIKQSIIDGMYLAFYEEREFTTADIVQSLSEIIPLAKLDEIKIKQLQQWALSGRIRLASK